MIRTGSVRLGAAAALLALTLLALAWPWARAAAFVVRAAGLSEQATGPSAAAVGLLTALADQPFLVQPLSLAGATGEIPARVYRPERRRGRTLIVVGGVNREGIDEPRLVKFAGDLAAAGIPVVTPELAALTEYRLTPTVTDDLEGIVAQVATRADLTGDSPVGLMGVSFAGGLSVVAAGRASVRDKVAYVLSFGGHGDLERVLRYLCTGLQPDRELRPPHDYGLAVMLLNLADRVVPPEQVDGLRRGIDEFLRASQLDMSDRARAADVFAEARRMEATLDEPARSMLAAVNGRKVGRLGEVLLPFVGEWGGDPALSPERSPAPAAPVYLLHGAADNVIPAVEARRLAAHLAPHTAVRLLETPLITHAEADRAVTVADAWRVVSFWRSVQSQ